MSDRSLLSPTGVDVVLILLGLLAIASALLVVTTKQIVHAALWLVVSLGAVAGCYLVMSAEFVAWMQVLIYLGAVVVLLLFGLMLTRAPIGPSEDLTGTQPRRRPACRRRHHRGARRAAGRRVRPHDGRPRRPRVDRAR